MVSSYPTPTSLSLQVKVAKIGTDVLSTQYEPTPHLWSNSIDHLYTFPIIYCVTSPNSLLETLKKVIQFVS